MNYSLLVDIFAFKLAPLFFSIHLCVQYWKLIRKIKQIIPRNRLNFVSLFFLPSQHFGWHFFVLWFVYFRYCLLNLFFDAIWCKMICSRPKLFLPCSVITFDYIVSIKHNLFLNKKKMFFIIKIFSSFWACWQLIKIVPQKRKTSSNCKKRKLIPSRIFAECWECEPKNSHWFQGQPASQLEFSRIFCTDFTTYFS